MPGFRFTFQSLVYAMLKQKKTLSLIAFWFFPGACHRTETVCFERIQRKLISWYHFRIFLLSRNMTMK